MLGRVCQLTLINIGVLHCSTEVCRKVVVLITGEVLSSPKKGRARSLCLRAKAGVLPCGENTGPAASEGLLPLVVP